jgi:hypothetical protein
LRNQWIRTCLKKAEAAGDYKQSQKKQRIASRPGGRQEHKGSDAVEYKTGDQAKLVAVAPHHHGRRH